MLLEDAEIIVRKCFFSPCGKGGGGHLEKVHSLFINSVLASFIFLYLLRMCVFVHIAVSVHTSGTIPLVVFFVEAAVFKACARFRAVFKRTGVRGGVLEMKAVVL